MKLVIDLEHLCTLCHPETAWSFHCQAQGIQNSIDWYVEQGELLPEDARFIYICLAHVISYAKYGYVHHATVRDMLEKALDRAHVCASYPADSLNGLEKQLSNLGIAQNSH